MFSKHFFIRYCLLVIVLLNPHVYCFDRTDRTNGSDQSQGIARLGLISGHDQVEINRGDWLVLEQKSTKKVLARGKYIKYTSKDSSKVLTLRLRNENQYHTIDVRDIGKIWIGPARETWKNVKKASKTGLIVGTIAGVIMVAPQGDWGWMSLTIPASIAFTVPAFGLGGAWYGKYIETNQAVSYPIVDDKSASGENPWGPVEKTWELILFDP